MSLYLYCKWCVYRKAWRTYSFSHHIIKSQWNLWNFAIKPLWQRFPILIHNAAKIIMYKLMFSFSIFALFFSLCMRLLWIEPHLSTNRLGPQRKSVITFHMCIVCVSVCISWWCNDYWKNCCDASISHWQIANFV